MIKLKVSDLLIDSPRWKVKKVDGSHTVGWVVKYDYKEYGDFVTIVEPVLTDKLLKECSEIMNEQLRDTMILVVGSAFIKDTGMSWKDFAMMKMELKREIKNTIVIIKE